MDKDELYNKIDEDDKMTDSEKLDAYFDEIDNYEAEQEWQDSQ